MSLLVHTVESHWPLVDHALFSARKFSSSQPSTAASATLELGIGAVCMRTALFTDVGIYEACNNKVRYYRKSVMRRVYLGE